MYEASGLGRKEFKITQLLWARGAEDLHRAAGSCCPVDVFAGENVGLVLAEIELSHEHQHVELPLWIGTEVTGQPQYYNSTLVKRPFCSWSRQDAPVPIERLA